MNPLHAAILGIVEGLTEFLPVSSTGHLILASHLLGLGQSDFQKTFEIVIQLGAIMAVVVLYWKSFMDIEVLKRLIVGFIPTGIIGLTLYKAVKQYLLASETLVLWSLAVGGAVLIAFELWQKNRTFSHDDQEDVKRITYKQALVIGLFQSIAIIPGVSRSAATIVGGMVQGIDRKTTVKFSFLLAVPTMLAATGLDLLKNAKSFAHADMTALAIGLAVSFVVAIAAIRFFLGFVRKRTFLPFGVYRVAIALAFWGLFLP